MQPSHRAAAAAFAFACLLSLPAWAAEPGDLAEVGAAGTRAAKAQPAAVERRQPVRWYGWQTIIPDSAAALTIGLLIAKQPEGDLPYDAASALYLLGAPAVHLGHGRIDTVFASLGLRVSPALFAVAADKIACPHRGDGREPPCHSPAAVITLGVGMLAAAVVDASTLAWEPAERPAGASVSPLLLVGSTHAVLGAAGTF